MTARPGTTLLLVTLRQISVCLIGRAAVLDAFEAVALSDMLS